ncbi:hypothetical protein G5S35_08225 [Paraburkholderia tropica]|uniref:hypothetical protein n=1 Tax=Paraburkholderia tropica TaxID=92647 RepID=UPI0015FF7A8C|nr:hypothetical protein [Paraburkholderia tropica]QNB11565.1 hypothetical protein G5S35_08225 [Paraburkholderia tropica]
MRKSLTAICVAASICLPATAIAGAHLNPGYVACTSEESLDEFVQAAVQKDRDGMKYMLGKTCLQTDSMANLKVSLLKPGFTVVKIRVYVQDDAVVLWAPREAFSEK